MDYTIASVFCRHSKTMRNEFVPKRYRLTLAPTTCRWNGAPPKDSATLVSSCNPEQIIRIAANRDARA